MMTFSRVHFLHGGMVKEAFAALGAFFEGHFSGDVGAATVDAGNVARNAVNFGAAAGGAVGDTDGVWVFHRARLQEIKK
jgi:hypothetical protein